MQRPIIYLTLAYCSGLLFGQGFLYFPYSIGILAAIVVLILAVMTWRERSALSLFLLIIIPGIIGMSAYLYSAAWLPPDHYTRIIPEDNSIHEITGKIVSPLDRDPDRTAFIMDLADIDGTPVSGKLRVSIQDGQTPVGYGDGVHITGKMYGPRGYHNPDGFDYASIWEQERENLKRMYLRKWEL